MTNIHFYFHNFIMNLSCIMTVPGPTVDILSNRLFQDRYFTLDKRRPNAEPKG